MFQATVPVFRHYLSRIADIVAIAGPDALDLPGADGMTARQQFAAAAGLSMRVACPLAGREVPDLPEALGPRLAVARALLGVMKPADFTGAEARVIRHGAGGAAVDQPAPEFLFLWGLPNFFFHMSMGYAALLAAGVPLEGADFDGFHRPG